MTSKTRGRPAAPDNFAIIIGAMKSGTTSLFNILSQHPQICPSRVKEPDFFTKDYDTESLDQYLSLWNWDSEEHIVAMESSVAYTKAPIISGVPERICQSRIGRFKFIYVMRDPLSRIESQVRHGLFAGWGKSLDSGVPQDAVDFSSYSMQINEYLEFFPASDIILVILEEFSRTPDIVLSRICRFLRIDDAFQFRDIDKRSNDGEFFNSPTSIAYLTQGSIGQYISQNLLSPRIKAWLREVITKIGRGKSNMNEIGRWKLSDFEREHILNALRNDLEELRLKHGVEINKFWDMNPKKISKDQTT